MAPTKKASASVVRKDIEDLRRRFGWTPSDIINLLRGGGSSSKGSSYERELCKQLSLWWTNGDREDIFWRSSGSGARAKVRGRAGRATAGQHGDMAATDPIGAPFIEVFTVEIKRGYSEHTVQDMLDRGVDGGVQEWERFFSQTIESHQQAGSYSWLLITRRDRRRAMIWMPMLVYQCLRSNELFSARPTPYIGMRVNVRSGGVLGVDWDICGMTLDSWLSEVTPESVKNLVRR